MRHARWGSMVLTVALAQMLWGSVTAWAAHKRFIVVFQPGTELELQKRVIEQSGGEALEALGMIHARVALFPEQEAKKAVRTLMGRKGLLGV